MTPSVCQKREKNDDEINNVWEEHRSCIDDPASEKEQRYQIYLYSLYSIIISWESQKFKVQKAYFEKMPFFYFRIGERLTFYNIYYIFLKLLITLHSFFN